MNYKEALLRRIQIVQEEKERWIEHEGHVSVLLNLYNQAIVLNEVAGMADAEDAEAEEESRRLLDDILWLINRT